MLRSTVLLFLLWCACARAVDFEDCSIMYEALSIDISGCPSAPCNIVPGSRANVTATFLANSESNVLYQNVSLRLNSINFNVTASPPPCSAGSGTVCPVAAGSVGQYTAVLEYPENLIPVFGSLFLRLNNTQGTTMVCYRVSVRVVFNRKAPETLQP